MKWRPRMAWASGAGGSWSAAGRQLVGSWSRIRSARQKKALDNARACGFVVN